MAKNKRNKPKFWCPECRRVGYRNQVEAQVKAGDSAWGMWECPHHGGFHIGPSSQRPRP